MRCLVCEDLKNKHLWRFSRKTHESKWAIKLTFNYPLMKNTTNWEVLKWSSSVQIFHALTWQRKTATAAAERRNPWPTRVRRWQGRGSEALPHRRRWSSGGVRVWEAWAGERSSGVKVKWGRGRGIYSGSEKLYTRGNWTNMPLALLIRLTCVTHVLRSGDLVRSWVNR